MTTGVLYLADRNTDSFQRDRLHVGVVCAGDSLTGWNNYGAAKYWPYPTYPRFLQESCLPLGITIADCGIAGEISHNGIDQVQDYLELFPNARYFVIGFGTNDLGMWPNVDRTSQDIIDNLNRMVQAIAERGKRAMLFNIPYANESMFSGKVVEELHHGRDHHNGKLKEYCIRNSVPLADICSNLHDEHLADELHPNAAGARIIAEEVFKVLKMQLPPQSPA
jgi:lysophospholipase L1-like esterase